MPKVLEQDGCKVFINTDDHAPPHVHIKVGDGFLITNLDEEVSERKRKGNLKESDVRRARLVVQMNRELLLERWNEIHRK